MNYLRIIILLFISLFLVTCETDFDINAEWKDITVVYGALNQNDSIHYLRIQKAFLGKGNVMQMTLEPDSNLYPGKINVVVDEYNNSTFNKRYVLDTVNIYDKDSGIFFTSRQPVFYFPAFLNPNFQYHLTILKNNGETVTAQTPLVGDFGIVSPIENSTLNFNPPGSDTRTFKWRPAPNAGRYQMIMRFNYLEINTYTGDSSYHYTEWYSPFIKAVSGSNADIELGFSNSAFFTMVENQVQKRDDVKRYPVDVELIFYVAATDLSLYIEINEPSSSIIQEKPEYTNISNGLGVFSARFQKKRVHLLHLNTITKLREMEGYNFQWIPTK